MRSDDELGGDCFLSTFFSVVSLLYRHSFRSTSSSALLTELSALTDKIRVAIAIHTDAVTRTHFVRGKFVVKVFRLAGTAPLPVTYEFESDVL